MATATANHHQRQINLHKLQSQSLDLQQIPNPKISTKKEKKKKKKLKIFNKHYRPTTATNIAGPKLNQPLPQPRHHHRPKIPTQPINQWPKTHTSKPIPNITPTNRLRDLKVSGKGCGGRRQRLWRLTVRWGGERSWAKMREILSREDWEGRDREWRREKRKDQKNKVMREVRERWIKKE